MELKVIVITLTLFSLLFVFSFSVNKRGLIPNTHYYFQKHATNTANKLIGIDTCKKVMDIVENEEAWRRCNPEYNGWLSENSDQLSSINHKDKYIKILEK